MALKFNLNYDYKDIKMDNLLNDVSKKETVILDYNHKNTTSSLDNKNASPLNNNGSNVEIVDLSLDSNKEINNSFIKNNIENNKTHQINAINNKEIASQNINISNQNTTLNKNSNNTININSNTTNQNSTINLKSNTSDLNKNNINLNRDPSSIKNNTANINDNATNLNNNSLNANNNLNKSFQNKSSSNLNNFSTVKSDETNSKITTNNSKNKSLLAENNNKNLNQNSNNNLTEDNQQKLNLNGNKDLNNNTSKNNLHTLNNIYNNKEHATTYTVDINSDESTTKENKQQNIDNYESNSKEVNIDEIINVLETMGINENDINRVISNEISLENLLKEIQLETNNERRRKLLETEYLKAYNLDFNNLKDLEKKSKEINNKLVSEIKIKNNLIKIGEKEATLEIIKRLKQGENLSNILTTYVIAWKYTDELGNVTYKYENPNNIISSYAAASLSTNNKYEPVTYESLYGKSESYKKLKNLFIEEKLNEEELKNYFNELINQVEEEKLNFTKTQETNNSNIEKLTEEKQIYDYALENINYELDYYFKNIDPYIIKNDFLKNCKPNNSLKTDLLKIVDISNYHYNEETLKTENNYQNNIELSSDRIIVNDKNALVTLINSLINNTGILTNDGKLSYKENPNLFIESNHDILSNYQKWSTLMTENEIATFNYIFNKEGYDNAYKYLEDISDSLDRRWLANKQKEDQEWASTHPVLASLSSIVVTPIEGISSIVHSVNSLVLNEKIRRTKVYSAGDIYRQKVGSDIANNYGDIAAFWYNTGMSMADSTSLIGLNIATGGGASALLSTTLMGSRAYVSTLNDALDRGVSDGAAVALAFSSATVESAMESYSLGHLMNLENTLSTANKNFISKVSDNITNKTLSKITKNSLYIGMGAISQGLCEGEEEFATEILNHYADELISGNLSSYNQTISEYVQLGYSEEKARIEADKIYMNQLYQAFLGGFASGVCFGSFGAGYDTHKKSQIMANNIIENNQSLSINSDSFSEPSLNFNAQNDINLNLTNNNYNTEANQITSSNQQKNNSETVIKFNKNFSFIERIRFKNNLKNVSSAEPYQAFEQALKNAKNCEDSSVRTIIKNLYKLKVLRPDFKLDYSKNGGAWSEFASGNIYLTPSRIIYKMDTVIYHELGHTLHSAINSSKIPKNYYNILDTVENEIFNKKEYAASITNFMNDLFENYEKEATKKIDLEEIKSEVSAEMQQFSIDNLAEDLKSVGLSDEVIKKIESKKYKERFDELVEHKKQKKIVEYCEIEAQKEGIAPVSDIICSLFYGKGSLDYYDSEIGQRVKIGSNLRLGHSKEYFKSKSNPTEASFHEQIANYIQLKFTNNTKYLEMIQNLLGQEWTNAMEGMYNNIVNYFANETVDLEQINEIAQDSQLEKTDELPQINNDEIFEKTEELPQLNNDEIFEKTEELPLININKQFDTIFSEPQFLGSSSSKTNYNSTYNQSYDYNYTLNYIVDIINRKYGNGIDYIKAYYEKNDSSFITKEGDCRYYIEQIPKEVIGAYLGYNINSNNNQNYNYDNNTNVSNQNSTDILNYIIDILNRKYGDGLERLRIYYEKSDLSVITREGECRDYIQQVSKEDLATYLGYNINTNNNQNSNYDNNTKVSNQNSTDILNYIIDILNRKYGDGLERLRNYYENGSLSVITREGDCRDYIQKISKEDLAAYLGYDINKNSNQNYNYDNNANISTQNREILDYIFELINRKYGDGFVRLKAYCDNGNLSVIPNEGNCSDYIQQIPKEDILTYLGYDINVIKNLQDKDTRINKIFDEMPNPIQNYSVLDKIVSKYFLNNGGSLYCNLVSVNTPRTKYAPTLDQITRFNNRFIYSGKYNAIAQGNAFIHIKSKQELDNINHRLYINADYHMTYAFAEAFANKCESRNIPFYFKTMPFNGEINEFGLYRDESIVIYSDDNYFADYVEICREIKNEFAGFELMPPPVFSGLIDGWIGYGGENKTDHSKSFNQIRTQIIAESMQKTMEYYQITDIKSLKRHKRRYKKFLDLLFQNIYYICSNYGVSPDNFAITTN